MKLVSIVRSLPDFTQNSVLWTLLGSLNASAINAAAREVATDIKTVLQAKDSTATSISIDVYNEMLNELRQGQLNEDNRDANGFDTVDEEDAKKHDFLDLVLTIRSPLLAMFHEVNANLPARKDKDTGKYVAAPDFSFEESLARQLAMEYSAQAAVDEAEEKALIDSGAVTAEELKAVDKEQWEADRNFRKEFKFLIIDKCNSRVPEFTTVGDIGSVVSSVEQDEDGKFHAVRDEVFQAGGETIIVDDALGDVAFSLLPEAYQHRLIGKLIPKLESAKRQQILRRSYDKDATTNIMIVGLALNEMRKFIGPSSSDKKLAAMQAVLA
jgi:hypothetical protein